MGKLGGNAVVFLALAVAGMSCSGTRRIDTIDAGSGGSLDGGTSTGSGDGSASTDGGDGASTGDRDGSSLDDGSAHDVDAGSSAERLARMVQDCHDWGDIACNAEFLCCMTDQQHDMTLEDCRMRYYVGCDYLLSGDAFTDGNIDYDFGAAADYNARMRALGATCALDANIGSGKFFFGTLPSGADCTPHDPMIGPGRDASNLLACQPGLYCKVTTGADGPHGVCTAQESVGAPCGAVNITECQSSLICGGDIHSHTCTAPDPDGAPCTFWTTCAAHYCADGMCTSTPSLRWCQL